MLLLILLLNRSDVFVVGDEYRYERDNAGQIIRETDFTGREIQYRYDRLGRRTATRYPDQHEIRWSYSPEGLITRQDTRDVPRYLN
ncbi:RHS repeat protein [Morganella morganii subsp. morganii]|uniref:RHS repeat domain-containing protein n=1 Tax=Morganella morganii TaxID=582 RepID=UPI001BD92A38|nr:RHS repeat domain-containing protein [Morganella morganii]MBT0397548.1 RHS repeat protein [Morganella morganii subsp. morganii]